MGEYRSTAGHRQGDRTGRASSAPLRPGAIYFSLVFAVGFVLGTIRVLVVVPLLGERAAELLEAPLMLLASFLAARWVVRRFRLPPGARCRLPVGLVALTFLLVAELLVVFLIRGLTLEEYMASRDPVAGAVYLVSLAVFALMPWLVRGAASSE